MTRRLPLNATALSRTDRVIAWLLGIRFDGRDVHARERWVS